MSGPRSDPPPLAGRTTSEEERDLLARLGRNDRDALAALFDRYGGLAFGLALRILGERAEAEDVVQESFLTLWRQAGQVDTSRPSVRPYLLTIVHRRAIDAVRRRTGRPQRVLDELASVPADAPDPADVAARSEAHDAVRDALEVLPADQRQAIELTYFRGLTVAEMAQEEGIPVGTAKSRLRLALRRMKTKLAGEPRL